MNIAPFTTVPVFVLVVAQNDCLRQLLSPEFLVSGSCIEVRRDPLLGTITFEFDDEDGDLSPDADATGASFGSSDSVPVTES